MARFRTRKEIDAGGGLVFCCRCDQPFAPKEWQLRKSRLQCAPCRNARDRKTDRPAPRWTAEEDERLRQCDSLSHAIKAFDGVRSAKSVRHRATRFDLWPVGKASKRYTPDEKAEIISQIRAGATCAQLQREGRIGANTIRLWMRRFEEVRRLVAPILRANLGRKPDFWKPGRGQPKEDAAGLFTTLRGNSVYAKADAHVPRHYGRSDRDDIIMLIVLAVLEGDISEADIPKHAKRFIAAHFRGLDRYRTRSLDAPIGEDGFTLADVIPSDPYWQEEQRA